MFMDVGKPTVQLSHAKNYITVCKAREGTLLQTKMILDFPIMSPMNLNSYFSTKKQDDWKPSIAFVVGTKIEDEIHAKALSLAVQVPQRKLFSVITREDIFRQVLQERNF
ncbi:hypothetical protein Q9233_013563 [Columba guinea]|nr:hypothetical protein Q9233_013563 [Columba guinea]